MTAILWFRNDLRLQDNPALTHLSQEAQVFLPLYIWDTTSPTPLGGPQQWWLYHSLLCLQKNLKKQYNASLLLLKGNPKKILDDVIEHCKASFLFWNRCYDPHSIERDSHLKEYFQKKIAVQSFSGSLLCEPWEILNSSKKPFKVFTPFSKACLAHLKPFHLLKAPVKLKGAPLPVKSDSLADWKLLSSKEIPKEIDSFWTPGEDGAEKCLKSFLDDKLAHYANQRDFPDNDVTSRLSPYLHFGEISPHQIWATAQKRPPSKNLAKFQSELLWREFSYYLLFYFPKLPSSNFNTLFDHFPWHENHDNLEAWKEGKTGYPLVDAGMRQLKATGWMHNRVRMVVASFLTKHLLISWRKGSSWFWDHLVDADLANNSMGWQWVAGSGPDAAPYFRIFNPILQSQKFDSKGNYIRKWVPELKSLSDKDIHTPWIVSKSSLEKAGIILGATYPLPIVNHDTVRKKALQLYKIIKEDNP